MRIWSYAINHLNNWVKYSKRWLMLLRIAGWKYIPYMSPYRWVHQILCSIKLLTLYSPVNIKQIYHFLTPKISVIKYSMVIFASSLKIRADALITEIISSVLDSRYWYLLLSNNQSKLTKSHPTIPTISIISAIKHGFSSKE